MEKSFVLLFFAAIFVYCAGNDLLGGTWMSINGWFILGKDGSFISSSSLFVSYSCFNSKRINGEYNINNKNTLLYLNIMGESVIFTINYNTSNKINNLVQISNDKYIYNFVESHAPSFGVDYYIRNNNIYSQYNTIAMFRILDTEEIIFFNGTIVSQYCYSNEGNNIDNGFQSGNNYTSIIKYKSFLDESGINHINIIDDKFVGCDYLIFGNFIIQICDNNNFVIIYPY